jgi:hypothetical protein
VKVARSRGSSKCFQQHNFTAGQADAEHLRGCGPRDYGGLRHEERLRGIPAIPAVRGQAPTILCVLVPREVPGYIRSHRELHCGRGIYGLSGMYIYDTVYVYTVITLPFLLLPIAIYLSVTDLLYVVYGGIWLSPPLHTTSHSAASYARLCTSPPTLCGGGTCHGIIPFLLVPVALPS